MIKCIFTSAAAVLFATAMACVASAPKPEVEAEGYVIAGVRTTAYSHSPEDNGIYGAKNALGTRLKSGAVTSAAADWSCYPVGTRFRVVETGRDYIIDDYGSALVGTGTIDLYKTSDAQVDRWGVRRVTIKILEWGSAERSLRILEERGKMRHIRKMVKSLLAQDAG